MYKLLTPEQIPFLQNQESLYVLDFRALGESIYYDIPSMWKYENLLPRILSNQSVCINEGSRDLQYHKKNKNIMLERGTSARVSLAKKLLQKTEILSPFKNIYVPIAHPDFDVLATETKKLLSYSYTNFLKNNNKITQKKLIGDSTPSREKIENLSDIKNKVFKKRHIVKRAIGSGGYTNFFTDQVETINPDLFKEHNDRFIEEYKSGKSMSVQCVQIGGETSFFGVTEQIILEGKHFSGAEILNPQIYNDDKFLSQNVENCTKKLQPLLEGYEGFWGIDFLYDVDQKSFWFLEANIRMTAMTIPTLLHNSLYQEKNLFREDVIPENIKEGDIKLTYDLKYDSYDILSSKL